MNKRVLFTLVFIGMLICSAKQIFADQVIVGYRHLADPGTLVYNGRI